MPLSGIDGPASRLLLVVATVVKVEVHAGGVVTPLGKVDLPVARPVFGFGPQQDHRVILRVTGACSHSNFPPPVLAAVEVCGHAARGPRRVSSDAGDAAIDAPGGRATKPVASVAGRVVDVPLGAVGCAR